MRLAGISESTVSTLCKDIDGRVNAFFDRPHIGDWPYLWLNATHLKQREGGRIVLVAAITAVAVDSEGRREIVGLHVKPRGLPDIGPSEANTFWSTFLRNLVRRGLRGVKLVTSDAHDGLTVAIRRVMGATWQRCRVHWMRNALAMAAPAPLHAGRRHGRPDLAHHRRQGDAPPVYPDHTPSRMIQSHSNLYRNYTSLTDAIT